eukprot:m.112669 g.112669  ORF g.112669 m.112669 type:complete len:275 (+) comp17033_c1_seq3:324-1148(+)
MDAESIRETLSLRNKIGKGAFASVYLAQDRSGRTVAVKRVRLDSTRCDLDSCRREVLILTRTSNQFIVKIFGAFVTGKQLWIVMEHMSVGSIDDILRTIGAFTEDAVARVMHCCVSALAYLHARGQVHRDIKPANILLDQAGNAKLCDLGVSFDGLNEVAKSPKDGPIPEGSDMKDPKNWFPHRPRHDNADSAGADGGSLNMDEFVGTPNYIAPEVVMQQSNTPLSDMWSVRATCHVLVPPIMWGPAQSLAGCSHAVALLVWGGGEDGLHVQYS